MINLLPPENIKELRASRTNRTLGQYLFASLMMILLVLIIFGAAFFINERNREAYEQRRQNSEQELARLIEVKKQIGEYNKNLKIAKEAFETEKKMSVLISNFSKVLPPGAVLSGISLNVGDFEEPLTISAQVKSFQKAGVLKRNFEQSDLFDDVTLSQISETATSGEEKSAYPFSAQMEVTLNEEIIKEKQNKSGSVKEGDS